MFSTIQKRVFPAETSQNERSSRPRLLNCFGPRFQSRVVPTGSIAATLNFDFNSTIQKISISHFNYVDTPCRDEENYGEKHANLKRVDRVVKAAGLEGVEVPPPHSLSSEAVENFLQEQSLGILPYWNKLGALYQLQDGFLNQKEVSALLLTIQANIAEAFKRAKEQDLLPFIASPKFLAWLDQTEDFLMVRSTGNEDSALIANAGGNISVAYVRPTRQAFCDAACEVLSSYFSQDSLQNLINAKIKPFAQKPTLAVMAQRLIGEQGQEIPISLVLFTNEPLYVGKERFRCMKISATYGHGEGVVGGVGIGTDSVLLLESETDPQKLYAIYTNGDKPQRLAPIGGKLAAVDNPPHLRKQFALNEKMLARLFTLGVVVEKGFDAPADMEIVIKGETIYPVQARPINRPQLLPTYLKTPPSLTPLQGETLVAGTASAVVAAPHEICFAPTLREAERAYKGEKGVVVHSPEPANSHPIVNFSSLGVPCFYLSDFQKLKTHAHPVVLCMQEGTATLWDPSFGRPEEFIVEGYTTHPAPISISLPHEFGYRTKGKNLPVPQDVKELLLLVRSSVALKALKELHSHPFVTSLQRDVKHPVVDSLINRIEAAFQEAAAAIRNSDERLRTLLHVKVLETLLVKNIENGAVGEYSRISVAPYLEDAKELASYQAKFPNPVRFSSIFFAGDSAIDPSSKDAWRAFLEKSERERVDPVQEKRFISAIKTLETGKILPLWFAFFFKRDASLKDLLASIEETSIQKVVELSALIAISKNANLQKLQELSRKVILLASQTNSTSPLTSLLLLNTIYEAVDLFDLSIKQMKVSTEAKEKTPLFKKMIGAFFSLLKGLLQEVQHAGSIPLEGHLNEYMQNLETFFNELPELGDDQLRSSFAFSVAATALGTKTRNKGYRPHTLEDFFTLVHQNLLALLSHCASQWISDTVLANSALPDEVKQSVKTITENPRATRTGVEISEKIIRVKYNFPLRSHSAQLILNYDLSASRLTLQALFLGENELNRWDMGSNLVQALSRLGIGTLHSPVQMGGDELIVTWKIYPEEIPTLLKLFQCIIDISFEHSFSEFPDDWVPGEVAKKIVEKFKVDREKVAEIVTQSTNRNEMQSTIFEYLLFQLDTPNWNFIEDCRFWGIKAFRDNDPVAFEHFRNYISQVKPHYSEFIPQIARMQMFEDRDTNTLKIMNLFNSVLGSDRSLAEPFKHIFTPLVKAHMKSGNPELRKEALELAFKIDEPELQREAAINGSNDPHLPVRERAFGLFNNLVSAKLCLLEGTAAAKRGLNDPELSIRCESYYLYGSLIRSGAKDLEALSLAVQWDKHQNDQEKRAALKLFIPLVAKGESFKQALEAAQIAEKLFEKVEENKDDLLFEIILKIYEALIQQGVYYEQAKAVVLRHEKRAICLLNALVDRGEALEQAVDVAVKLTKDFKSAYFVASKLFKKLYERNVETEKLLEALFENGLKHEYLRQQDCAYLVIKETYLKDSLAMKKFAALLERLDNQYKCNYKYQYLTQLENLIKNGATSN